MESNTLDSGIREIHTNCIEIKYTNPTNTITSERNTDTFFDDTSIGATADSIYKNANLTTDMNKAIQK